MNSDSELKNVIATVNRVMHLSSKEHGDAIQGLLIARAIDRGIDKLIKSADERR